jgi:hypothetical protein
LTWGIWQAIFATATTAVVFFATLSNVPLRKCLITLGVFTIAPLLVVGWTTPPQTANASPASTNRVDAEGEADPGSESQAANQAENLNQTPIEKSLSKTPLGRDVLNFSTTWAQRLGLTSEVLAGLMLSVIISAIATTIAIWPLRLLGFFLSK